MEYATKTEIYQKIKKPLLERQRRARINKCLDDLKHLMVDLKGNNNKILRMDKAEILENTIIYLRQHVEQQQKIPSQQIPLDIFRNGYLNAVNEVSGILASTSDMKVQVGKSLMTLLGRSYNRLQQQYEQIERHEKQQIQHNLPQQQQMELLTINCPVSPASSGYHSDTNGSSEHSPVDHSDYFWRPW